MKEKIRLEDVKEFKIEHGVFDEKTLFAIHRLLTKGMIKSVESIVKEGKESVILSGKDKDGDWLAIKVYRTKTANFKSMWTYLVEDPRFSGLKKFRRTVVYTWGRREFKNMKIAFENGISCPQPVEINENVLVMTFIGEDGMPAPRLIDVKLENPKEEYDFILNEIEKLLKAGIIHTDLSAYNILFYDKPYLIDFSQAVPLEHQSAQEFLKRDIKNVNSYFQKNGVEVKDADELFNSLVKMVVWK